MHIKIKIAVSFLCLINFSVIIKGETLTNRQTVYPSVRKLYVSVNGNDAHDGSLQHPIASIEHAKMLVRLIKGPVNVYIRQGVYYLNKPVVFDHQDARKKNAPATFQAYQHEKVIISGAIPLKLNWRQNGKTALALVPDGVQFDQLFVNGKAQRQARYPDFDPNARNFGGVSADALSPERIARWKNPAGGYIHSLHASEWGDFSFQITGKDAQGNLTMIGGFQNNRPSAIHPYIRFVENVAEELDQPEEFYFNVGKRELSFMPPKGLNIQKAVIEIPQLESLFEFRGTEQKPVSGINLSGLILTHTLRTFMKNKEPLLRSDWTIYRIGAVTLEGAVDCKVINCDFQYLGGNAVVVSNYNRRDTIEQCYIHDIGSSAVVFVGDSHAVRSALFRYEESNPVAEIDRTPGPQSNNYPAYCRVNNNLIERIGQVEKQVAGVQLSMSADVTVSHNTIDDVPRAGININEGTWGGHIIEYNDVFNTVKETGDHGAFNSWGRDRYWQPDRKKMDSIVAAYPELIGLDVIKPIVLRYNRFRCDHGWDIDLDDGSSNYRIYNNVCLSGGIKLREGFNRIVENNVMINNSFHPHVWFKNSGDVFAHNIVTRPYFPVRITSWGKTVDYNLFPDTTSLLTAQKNGTDIHSSVAANPFVNVNAGNYKLKDSLLATSIGFHNFSMNDFGVQLPALKRVAQKVNIPQILLSDSTADGSSRVAFLGGIIKNVQGLADRSVYGLPDETGVVVISTGENTILQRSGLSDNDVIRTADGKAIRNVQDLIAMYKLVLNNKNNPEIIFIRNQQKIKKTLKLF